jgi:NADPH-dependent 2,4-dienoyl-CoA reductase/sulfur reductase-like enzyme
VGERIVIIGGVAAGTKAAATARRRNSDLDILVLQEESDVSYSACGIPYRLADPDAIPRKALIARTVDAFRRDRIDVRVRHKVEAIEVGDRRVAVTDLDTGQTERQPFDRLLIATGAEPVRLAIPAARTGPPVVYLRSLDDMDRISALLPGTQRVAIVGGGYVGLEMTEMFRALGRTVTLVEMAGQLVPNFKLETRLADKLQRSIVGNGVDVRLGAKGVEITQRGLLLDTGQEIAADLVLIGVGVKPCTTLARQAGIGLGQTGAIGVDAKMRTSFAGVFAAGDCAEARHRISGLPVWYPLGDIANRQGRVAGVNMAGGDAVFPGVLGTAIFRAFELAVARTGLNVPEAIDAGFDAVSVHVSAPSRARYWPDTPPIEIVLVADRGNGRLLGAQAVGEQGVDKAIDVIAAALWGGLGVDDLAEIDLAYAPPFSPVFAPVQVIGEVLRNRLRKGGA